MRPYRILLSLFISISLLGSVAGCGSGGEGGSAANDRTVDVYVTDSFRDEYSHVLVTLYKIEAATDGGSFQTLYEDPDGQTLDLVSLADAAQLLGSVKTPDARFDQVRVIFADHITLTPKSGGQSQSIPVEDRPPLVVSSGGKTTVTLTARTEAVSAKLSNLIVDFDLGAFALVGGRIRPAIIPGDPAKFHSKQHRARLLGIVSNLRPDVGFELALPHGERKIAVSLSADTSISLGRDGTDGQLADGQTVVVEGIIDRTTHVLSADAIRIIDRVRPQPLHGAIGTVSAVDSANLRFDLTVRHAVHLRPAGDTIRVQTTSETKFHRLRHGAAGFGDVAAGGVAAAAGTFDPDTQTLHAKRVELLPADRR